MRKQNKVHSFKVLCNLFLSVLIKMYNEICTYLFHLFNMFQKLQSICPRYTEEDYTIATQYGELSPFRPRK